MDGDQVFKGPQGEILRFEEEAVKNNYLSEKKGIPVFDNMLFVEVMTPGSNESVPRFEVERTYHSDAGKGDGPQGRMVERTPYYERFKEAVERYKAADGGTNVEGMPLDKWPALDRGTAKSFKALGILTVEMLASVHDGNLGNLGTGGRVLREQAKQYLLSRQFAMPSAELAADKANLETEVQRLSGLLAERDATIAELTAKLQTVNSGGPVDPLAPPPAPVDPLAPPPASGTTIV